MRLLLLILLTLTGIARADYSTHPQAKRLAAELAASGHYESAQVMAILRQAKKNPKLIQLERTAPEKTRSWSDYRQIFLNPSRIANGVKFWNTHAAALGWAEALYGVPPEYIVAIIGVETLYGGYTGPHRVLDSLTTQGFDHPSRHEFFYQELKNFLMLCAETDIQPTEAAGSYAGAMGLAQFMPSNYRRLALDFDHDGVRDLWSPADAIGSIAHYLVKYRPGPWIRDLPTSLSVSAGDWAGLETNSRSPQYRWADVRDRTRLAVDLSLPPDSRVALVELDDGDATIRRLALANYFKLFSYNPRHFYASAVQDLARAIAQARD